MFVCVVSLSQSSSRDCHMLYVKCLCVVSLSQPSSRDCHMLYVKCLCVLSRYLSPVVELSYVLNVCVCCHMLYVICLCVCCLVISVQ